MGDSFRATNGFIIQDRKQFATNGSRDRTGGDKLTAHDDLGQGTIERTPISRGSQLENGGIRSRRILGCL